jgi:hypothetical protein
MNLTGAKKSTNVEDKRAGQSTWDAATTLMGMVGRNIAADFTSGDNRPIQDISSTALAKFSKPPVMKKKNPFSKAVKG